jgi:hypothetical protein
MGKAGQQSDFTYTLLSLQAGPTDNRGWGVIFNEIRGEPAVGYSPRGIKANRLSLVLGASFAFTFLIAGLQAVILALALILTLALIILSFVLIPVILADLSFADLFLSWISL